MRLRTTRETGWNSTGQKSQKDCKKLKLQSTVEERHNNFLCRHQTYNTHDASLRLGVKWVLQNCEEYKATLSKVCGMFNKIIISNNSFWVKMSLFWSTLPPALPRPYPCQEKDNVEIPFSDCSVVAWIKLNIALEMGIRKENDHLAAKHWSDPANTFYNHRSYLNLSLYTI